jgi:hypothetical protein
MTDSTNDKSCAWVIMSGNPSFNVVHCLGLVAVQNEVKSRYHFNPNEKKMGTFIKAAQEFDKKRRLCGSRGGNRLRFNLDLHLTPPWPHDYFLTFTFVCRQKVFYIFCFLIFIYFIRPSRATTA